MILTETLDKLILAGYQVRFATQDEHTAECAIRSPVGSIEALGANAEGALKNALQGLILQASREFKEVRKAIDFLDEVAITFTPGG